MDNTIIIVIGSIIGLFLGLFWTILTIKALFSIIDISKELRRMNDREDRKAWREHVEY